MRPGVGADVRSYTSLVDDEEARIRQRFLLATTLALGAGVVPIVVLARLFVAERAWSSATLVGALVLIVALIALHLAARRTSAPWTGVAFLAIITVVPVALTVFELKPESLATAGFLLVVPATLASPLVGRRLGIVATLAIAALAVALHVFGQAQGPIVSVADVQLLATTRTIIALVVSGVASAYFSGGLRRLAEHIAVANRRLARRTAHQSALASLGERALAAEVDLASLTVEILEAALPARSVRWVGRAPARVVAEAGATTALDDGALAALLADGDAPARLVRRVPVGGGPLVVVDVSPAVALAVDAEPEELDEEGLDFLATAASVARTALDRQDALALAARAEAQLRQAQRMESLGLLAGGVAHDFNNLLTVAIAGAAELGEHPTLDAEAREIAASVLDASQRGAELTRQLLTFARHQVLQRASVDIDARVTAMAGMLRRIIGEDVTLELALSGAPLVAHLDPTQLDQAITNLVVNARMAMPDGGHLRIETARSDDAASIAPSPVAAGAYAWLRITDDGVGMDAATRDRAFEPFFTTRGKGDGTGLGLAMVHGFVKQSGGTVWIESEPGRGTTFHLLLPLDGDAPAATSDDGGPAARDTAAAPPRRRVLLVEDDAMVRRTITRYLDGAGVPYVACSDAAEARARFAEDPDFDVLLTDVVMPHESGPTLATDLVALRPTLRTVFITGYAADTRALDGQRALVVQKPFTRAELLRAIELAVTEQ